MAAVAGMDTALAARLFHQVMFISNVLQNYAKKIRNRQQRAQIFLKL